MSQTALRGMTEVMDDANEPQSGTERVRMIVDTDEALRRAVQLRKLKMPRGTTLSDVVNGILRGTQRPLTKELAELEHYDIQPDPPPDRPGRKKP